MGYDVTFTLLSCLFFMGLVAFIAYRQTRGETDSAEGYFLAGRGSGGADYCGLAATDQPFCGTIDWTERLGLWL